MSLIISHSLAPGVPRPIRAAKLFVAIFSETAVSADPIWLLNALGVRLDRFVFCTKMSVHNTSSVTFGRETRKGTHDTDSASNMVAFLKA